MATQRNISQQSKEALLKSYQIKLKEDVKCMLENYEGKHLLDSTPLKLIPISLIP